MSTLGAVPEPKLELFPTTRIASTDSSIQVPAELVTDGIAIVPYLDLDEGKYVLGGGFSITHVASGRTFAPGQACVECAREVARRIAATSVDWDGVDFRDAATLKASLGDEYEAVVAALRLFALCGQQMCFHDDEPCGACGMQWQHAPHCIYVVGPMVARLNATPLPPSANPLPTTQGDTR